MTTHIREGAHPKVTTDQGGTLRSKRGSHQGESVGSKRGRVSGDGGYFGAEEVDKNFQIRDEVLTGGLYRCDACACVCV